MLVVKDCVIINLDIVSNFTRYFYEFDCEVIYLIKFNFYSFSKEFQYRTKEERDKAFDQILSDYQECKRVCRLD